MFSSGYRGTLRRYASLNELDGLDHRAYFSLRHLVSRRLTFFANDSFVRLPTTDQLELYGVPFQRTGSLFNAFASGIEARLTRTTDFTFSRRIAVPVVSAGARTGDTVTACGMGIC